MKFEKFLNERIERFNPKDKKISHLDRIDKIDFSGNIFISKKNSNTNMILIHPGDLVISGVNVSKGALSIYKGERQILATIHYSSYFVNSNINKDYLEYLIKTKKFLQLLKQQVKGGIKTEIKSKQFLSLKIEVPNLENQKKISQKIQLIKGKALNIESNLIKQKMYALNLCKKVLDENNKNKKENLKISDIFKLKKGFVGIKKAQPGPYPLVTTSKERLSHKEFQFNGEAILIPMVSSTGHGHASINRIHYEKGKFAVGSILCALLPIDIKKTFTRFYYYFLSYYKDELLVKKMKGSANVSLTQKSLSDINIPYFDFHSQKKLEKIFTTNHALLDSIEHSIEINSNYTKQKIEELLA